MKAGYLASFDQNTSEITSAIMLRPIFENILIYFEYVGQFLVQIRAAQNVPFHKGFERILELVQFELLELVNHYNSIVLFPSSKRLI